MLARLARFALVSGFLALPLAGCEETDDDGGSGASDSGTSGDSGSSEGTDAGTSGEDSAGGSGASEVNIQACRRECDFMLEFDCIDVDEHESCFRQCDQVSDEELEIFESCTDSSPFCDMDPAPRRQCLANLLDADPVDPGTTTTGSPTTCVDACNAYLATPCDPPVEGVSSCAEFCASLGAALEELAVMCLEGADGCTLPSECMFDTE